MSAALGRPQLLDALPNYARNALTDVAQDLHFEYGDVINQPGMRVDYIYFSKSAFFSQLTSVSAHGNLALALVGREGMVGTEVVLNVEETQFQTLVQGAGNALRIEAADFVELVRTIPELRQLMLRYVHVVMMQLAVTTVCNSFHPLTARLARWLLQSHDRSTGPSFHLTHQFLAQMLGVRRVGITNAAGGFRRKALISYDRGAITVLDRKGLEQASCGCDALSNDLYQKILGPPG